MSFLPEQLLLEEHQNGQLPPTALFHTGVTASFDWGECEVSLGKPYSFFLGTFWKDSLCSFFCSLQTSWAASCDSVCFHCHRNSSFNPQEFEKLRRKRFLWLTHFCTFYHDLGIVQLENLGNTLLFQSWNQLTRTCTTCTYRHVWEY